MQFLKLIESHKHAEILEYVKTCKCLASYEELALIERGNHEELMTYMATHYFEYENYLALLKRGNLNEIRFYILKNGIYYGDGEDELEPFLRNIAGELVDYLLLKLQFDKQYGLLSDSQHVECLECLIIKSGDHIALRRYLSRAPKPLQEKSLKLFNKTGYATAEDKLVYNLRFA